jgi:hypothetical protein
MIEGKTMKRIYLFGVILSSLTSVMLGQAKPRQASLAQQKMCAEQARKIFHEDNPTKPEHALTWQYTSHYEGRTNVCYIMTWEVTLEEKSTNISHAVYDAFEGREYASFIQIGKDVMECEITPPSQDKIVCKTNDEFQHLVEKYFGIAK